MISKYERLKRKLHSNANRFELTDDMFYLGNVISAAYEILKQQGFPIKEYVKKYKR